MSGSQEEIVKEFVRELQSIVETRPPVSKAKMMSITKSALKAMKFYKHVVMNIEKFILKCKPEYKIPGLYVIDSVIRQSRHQYGIEKDLFGSRFAKNILSTLENIEKCPPDDKNKISRVLNLWEKNAIFPPDLIKELFQTHQSNVNSNEPSLRMDLTTDKNSPEKISTSANEFERFRGLQETLKRAAVKADSDPTSILTEIQQITNQLLESQKKSTTNNYSNDEPSSTTTSIVNSTEPLQSNLAHVLDDFDYGSEDDDDNNHHDEESKLVRTSINNSSSSATLMPKTLPPAPLQYLQPPPGMFLNPTAMNHISFSMTDANNMPVSMSFDPTRPPPIFFQQPLPSAISNPQTIPFQDNQRFQPTDVDLRPEDMEDDNSDEHQHSYTRRRSRSRSRSREPKRSRSSSNSNNRRDSAASRLKETERRERRRKGLPPLKEDHLVVSSRTLWLGHLPKMISEMELREQLEPHGEINDINNIPPRGCAFVCFKERSDAARCLEKMRDFRFHGNTIKIAWAMNKGVKDRFKDYWDADHGCTYVPYSELKEIKNLTALADGGMIDEESMPSFLKQSVPPMRMEVPPPQQQQPPAQVQQQQQQTIPTLVQPTPSFSHPEYSTGSSLSSNAPPTVHLDPTNLLPHGSTFLMAQPHGSPIRVSLPHQMMPPGAQIIQVQSHPHGQQVQVVQRIAGQVFPNSQIIHQGPFGHMVTTTQSPNTIQLQHRPTEYTEMNQQGMIAGGGLHFFTNANAVPTHHHLMTATSVTATGAPLTAASFAHTLEGPALIQFHNDPHRPLSSTPTSVHFDDQHRSHLSSTDEQLLRLSHSSSSTATSRFSAAPPPSPTRLQYPNQFANSGNLPHLPPPSLLPTPTTNDDQQTKPTNFQRRPNRFEPREEPPPSQDNNGNYANYRGGRIGFNDRGHPAGIPRTMIRGRGGNGNSARGYNNNNNNERTSRPDSNDTDGYRNRGGFNRGGRGGPSRFFSRGSNNRDSGNEHSSTHRSSRSPERHSRNYSNTSSDVYSHHRSLPIEALRRTEKSSGDSSMNSNKSSLILDETNYID